MGIRRPTIVSAVLAFVAAGVLGAVGCNNEDAAGAGTSGSTSSSASSSSSSSTSSSSSSSSSSSGAIDTGVDAGRDAASLPAVVAPVFTTYPAGPGPFIVAPVRVTITSATEGADIFFTIDGSTPTPDSQRFTKPFDVITNTMVRALARKKGFADALASFSLSFNCPVGAYTPPSFSPAGGENTSSFNAVVTTPKGEATTICFTVDGPDPQCKSGVCSAGSSTYSGAPIPVTRSGTTVRAMACKVDSDPPACGGGGTAVVAATYTLKAAAVVATPPSSGSSSASTNVTLTTATMGGVIHYTTDGSVPTCTNGTTATDTVTFTVSSAKTVRTMVCRADFVASDEGTFVYGKD